jgi:hypothetical protein
MWQTHPFGIIDIIEIEEISGSLPFDDIYCCYAIGKWWIKQGIGMENALSAEIKLIGCNWNAFSTD